MNENHIGSRQKGIKSPNQDDCWQYTCLQTMDILKLSVSFFSFVFCCHKLGWKCAGFLSKISFFFRHKHSLKLSRVLLDNIQWCHAYKCGNAVLSCGHWLPAALPLTQVKETRYVWYDTFCGNVSMVRSQWHVQLYMCQWFAETLTANMTGLKSLAVIQHMWFVANGLKYARALAWPFNGDAHQFISRCSQWWYPALNHTLFPNIFFALNSLWLRYGPSCSDECSTFSR